VKRRTADAPRGKALDLWEAPEKAGEPLVCVATSFTFDATFFETECVGRFLQMDNHPTESESVAYLIEREEKLAAAKVCALVDRRHARDKESLRWDIIGVLVPRAIQHSKVALLVWGNHARVIIGSGNLTEPGYRKNVEIFGTIELSRVEGGDRDAVLRTMDFLEQVVSFGVGDSDEGTPKHRVLNALTAARRRIAHWTDTSSSGPAPVFGVPGSGVLPQVLDRWPAGGPPRTACVISPFFDVPGRDIETVSSLIKGLAERGEKNVIFCVRSEPLPDGRRRVYAPLAMVKKAEESCDVEVHTVSRIQDGELRLLHAKVLCLENNNWSLLLTGSSNFTAAGLTAATGGSFEANLLYRLNAADSESDLNALWPDVDEEALDSSSKKVVWDPEPEECEGRLGDVPLPACFHEAIYVPGTNPVLQVELQGELPVIWSIRVPDGQELLGSSAGSTSGKHDLAWAGLAVPFVLEVSWRTGKEPLVANWPVNVSNPAALAPPDALRDLTLEELLAILASSRPLPQAVVAVLKKRGRTGRAGGEVLDPLKRMDSPAFLLRRTKRVAAALDRLRERLERPALSKDAFEWRLNGPVGPATLTSAFIREAKLPGEAKFYLAELALTLSRVAPQRPADGGLSVAIVKDLLSEAITDIRACAKDLPSTPETVALDNYVAAAFRGATRP
jgi:hypothetical protein